jgi:hypothetical protein
MGRIPFQKIMIICIVILFIIIAGYLFCINMQPTAEPAGDEYICTMKEVLYPAVDSIQSEMDNTTSLVWNTARELDGVDVSNSSMDLTLLRLRRDVPISFEVGRFDENDTLIASTRDMDETIGTAKATTHYTEEEFRAAGANCIISDYGQAGFGEYGVTVTAPVYDSDGEYNGTLRLVINTGSLLSGLAEYLRYEYGYTIWVVQNDGLQIYDENTEEIGRNILTDPLYQTVSIQNIVHDILDNERGNVSYIFFNTAWSEYTQTNAIWETIIPGDGMKWRLVLTDNTVQNTGEKELSMTAEELKAFVENAYTYVYSVGKERALAEFNDPNGQFVDGELYIFAYDMNGTVLALPYQLSVVGLNRWYLEDTSGVKIGQRIIARAEQGGGYVFYLYPNPADNYTKELKLTYVMAVNDEWCIAAGVYMQNSSIAETLSDDWKERENLIRQVRNMEYLSKLEGEASVIEMIRDPNSEMQIEGLYPFAITDNGTMLADSMNHALEGTNQLGLKNSYGMSVMREAISLAKAGGGMMYNLVWDPTTMQENHVLIYIEPAEDESTYFGSMMILE